MEQLRYGFNKEQGTTSKDRGAAIFPFFLFISHLAEQSKSTTFSPPRATAFIPAIITTKASSSQS